jgi:outer membrane protein TolC
MVSSAQDVSIGVIYGDVSQETKDYLNGKLETELDTNFENTQYKPLIKKEVVLDNGDLIGAVSDLEDNENIDVIIVLNKKSFELLNEKSFKKIVLAPFIYGVHNKDKIQNLNTVTTDYNLKEIMDTLKGIKDINKVGILFSHEFSDTANIYKDRLIEKKLLDESNTELISLDEDKESVAGKISNLDALLVLSDDNDIAKESIANASKAGIPSFSFFFSEKNHSGALMGYSQDEDIDRRIRVASINLLKYYEGRNFSELTSVLGSSNLNIVVDYSIAEKADLYAENSMSEKIRIINEEEFGNIALTLKDAIENLLENNTDIKSKKKEVNSNEFDVKIAKSGIRPDLTATVDYSKDDATRAVNDTTHAENSLKGGITLSQVLYDENTFSNLTIQKKLYDAAKEGLRGEEVVQIKNLLVAYLNTLKSYADFEIEKYNSQLIKKYLNVAKTKYEIGSSGPEDVYRFESELASSVTSLEGIRSNIFTGNADLNRLLNSSMDNYFSISEKGIGDIINLSIFDDLGLELNKPWKINSSKNYFINKGIENSTEIKSLNSQIEAKERELKAAKRKRYIPTLTADANYNKDLKDPWGVGSDNIASNEFWSVGVGLSLPIYKGGELEYTKKQIEAELEKLKLDRESTIAEVSKDISSQYGKVIGNYRKIKSSEKSVEASEKNLKLQDNLYVRGKITITDMLDARNSLIEAEQRAASVKFDYYISIADMEKLCGKYYFEYNDVEKENINSLLRTLTSSHQEVM